MNFIFSITKHTYDIKKEETNVNQEVLSELANGGIEIDAYDGDMIYRKANEIMNDTNLNCIICSMEKGDYFFMIIVDKGCEDLYIVVDKRGVPLPACGVTKKHELDLEELVSSYC